MNFNPDFAYIPLKPGSKLPATQHGVKDARKPFDPKFELFPHNSDWGIACGKESNLLVLDIDVKSGGIQTLEELEAKYNISLLDYTYTVKTPSGGYHLYFRLNNHEIRNKVGFQPGWDIRSDGGYVKVYDDVVCSEDIQPIPDLLLDLIKESDKKTKEALVAATGEGVGEGGRNHYLARVAGKLQRSNLLTLEGLLAINDRDCDPPLDEAEVTVIYESVSRYVPDEDLTQVDEDSQGVTGGLLKESMILYPKDIVTESLNYLSKKELVKGTPTGIEGIDTLLGGGKRLGEITALTAVAKAGKSALLHFMIHKWLKAGIKVAFASREMSPQMEVIPNLLSLSFKENAWKAEMTEARIAKYTKEIENLPIAYTKGFGYISFDELKHWMLELKSQGYQHFVLDHLLYSMSNPEDFKEVSLFIRNLKAFVNQENIHLDLVIQPKQINLGEKIGAHSLRGGANLSQAINTLFTLERVPGVTNVSKLTLEFGRSRLCNPGSIYLRYDKETTEFEEVEPTEADNGPTFGE